LTTWGDEATARCFESATPTGRVAFATAAEWVAKLGDAKRSGALEAELRRLSFVPLIVVDEVGYR
jgi:DNA replication protein DnaC